MQNRKVTYRMYPNVAQTERLEELLGLHTRVYNTALEERIRVYAESKASTSFVVQCKALTNWRATAPALADINAQSLQVTLKRVDLAYQGFFRRVAAGETPGFPRFKSYQRFAGWGYKAHGDGWRLFAGDAMKHGHVRLSGVGLLRLRGKARTLGLPKTAEVLHKNGKWYLSVTIECEPQRTGGTAAMGLDWGVESFATIVDTDDNITTIENPRFLNKKQLEKLKLLQQAVSRKTNLKSKNRRKAVKRLATETQAIANRRKDFLHKTTAMLVKQYGLIATEVLAVKNMTAHGGAYKKGLNRSILDTAPSTFMNMLDTKAEEAGSVRVDVPTRTVKPSQTCRRCGLQVKKALSERQHTCACGWCTSRDANAAGVALDWALNQETTGWYIPRRGAVLVAVSKRETPPIAALAA